MNGFLKIDVLTPLEQSLRSIASNLDNVQKDQRYLRLREQKHRDTAESTNTRVYLYSLVESVLLVLIGVGQVRVVFFALKDRCSFPFCAVLKMKRFPNA